MRTNNFVVLIGIKSQELKKGIKPRFQSLTANQGFLLNIFMLLKVMFSFSNPLWEPFILHTCLEMINSPDLVLTAASL